jgi:hypothetical protein
MKEPTSPVFLHLEGQLGKMRRGWPYEGGNRFVVEFADRPSKGATTYATLGLSDTPLPQASGPAIRQELVFACRRSNWKEAADLLSLVVTDVRGRGRSLDRGEVLGPAGPLFPKSPFEALYCAPPVYYPDALGFLDGVAGSPLVIVWLLPITRAEAKFVEQRGWPAFEDLLEQQDLDLTDLDRPSFTLPKN